MRPSRLLSLAATFFVASSLTAATFTVTNTLDSGAGSLRDAIAAANAVPGADTIAFAIPGAGVRTIAPLTMLPDITGPVTLDGWSQPDFAGTPIIEISGAAIATPFTNGIHLAPGSAGSVLRGLIVNRFTSIAVYAESAGHQFFGSWIGLAADGTTPSPLLTSGTGIMLNGDDMVVGGTGPNERNVIGGNRTIQLSMSGHRNIVRGNYIGTDPTGLLDRSTSAGIGMFFANDSTIGGSGPGEGNLVSANRIGLFITGKQFRKSAHREHLRGRFGRHDGSPQQRRQRRRFRIGGSTNSIVANVIANGSAPDGQGVWVQSSTRVLISRNSFRDNFGLAIDLDAAGVTANDAGDADTGANDLQNFPVLTSAIASGGNVTIAGTLNSIAGSAYTVELYASAACDPSGYGEGETYLGSVPFTTDASGTGAFTVSLPGPATGFVTATARDASNNTSEFSACVVIASGPLSGTVHLTSSTYSVAEGDGSGSFAISRTGTGGPASVQYTLTDDTATNGADYTKTPAPGTVIWAAGETSTKTVSFAVTDDAIAESTETFTVALSAPVNVTLRAPASATYSIIDNDFAPGGKFGFTASTASVNEHSGVVTLDVTRTGGSAGEVHVSWSTANGSATAGSDYTAATQTLVWETGDTAPRQVVVQITDDPSIEGAETFTVKLTDPVGGTIGVPDTVTVTIVDDDHAGTLALGSATYDTSEAAGSVTITVNRTGGSVGPATVDYATFPGTATAADFTAVSGTLSWAAGESASKSFVVAIANDGTPEPAESFSVQLANPTGAALGAPSIATVTITASNASVPATSPLTLLLLGAALAGAALLALRD
jgi:hypothetical protein